MDITIAIPDEIGARWSEVDVGRRALEAFALEEFRVGHLTEAELRRLLGFATRSALDAFLKARHVYTDLDSRDLDQDRRDLSRLGL